jgi:hypothetical protein
MKEIKYVVENSEHVRIDLDKVRELAVEVASHESVHWLEKCPVDLAGVDIVKFLFAFNSISFSYWGEPKWTNGYERGTWCMIDALKRASGVDFSSLDRAGLEDVLRGNVEIPLLDERLAILRSLDYTVCTDDALEFVEQVVARNPSFEDKALYKGEEVVFNKRAQLLASDLGQVLDLKNLDKLTACADYILPMVLREKGVLVYSDELASKIDKRVELLSGGEEEVEIRAGTVWAVELAKGSLSAMAVNDYLWLAGDSVPADREYHRVRSCAY